MNTDFLPALVLFAFVSSITPGPNNLMLMTSGLNYGFRRTVPHMLGIGVGFVVMVLLVGIGIAEIFERIPVTQTILRVLSVLYLLWLAFRIARSSSVRATETKARPLSFWQAAAFQWVNPKGWTMALTATTVYTPDTQLTSILIVALVFGAINLPSVSSWALLGQGIARWLRDPRQLRLFNWTMAGLLVLSLYPVLFP